SNLLKSTSAKCKADKAKGSRPRMPIWDDYIEGEDDGHGHLEQQCEKPSTMEAHLALYCKGPALDGIRRRWLIKVAKRDKKILEEKPNIFTNQEVFQIVCDEDNTFYTSCKRISLIFEPIKQVITLLESHIANLANCFIGIVQIAIALKRIPTSNNFHTLAILQVPQLESMAQLHSFYISNIEKELKLHNFVKMELCNSALNKTIFAEMDNLNLNNYEEEEENEMNILDLTTNNITMAFQDLVDLSDPIFGTDNN
ncbi:40161_t:CDS:2, partial [Gigaspora margarita]